MNKNALGPFPVTNDPDTAEAVFRAGGGVGVDHNKPGAAEAAERIDRVMRSTPMHKRTLVRAAGAHIAQPDA